VTLSLTETPAMDALKLIAELGGMEWKCAITPSSSSPPGTFAARTGPLRPAIQRTWPGSPGLPPANPLACRPLTRDLRMPRSRAKHLGHDRSHRCPRRDAC
jgi:hypothetical protein